MSFKVSVLDSPPNLYSLPVAKIIDYPLEKADYKPFAQARLCVFPGGLLVQMWAFESSPSQQSSLRVVLRGPADRPGVSAQLWSNGRLECTALRPGSSQPWEEAEFAPPLLESLWGEDLQGVYWGGSLTFPADRLAALWGCNLLAAGQVLQGNLYKLSDDPYKPHSGSLFPADFAGGDPFGPGSMGRFELVSY